MPNSAVLRGRDVVSSKDFTRTEIEQLFALATEMEKHGENYRESLRKRKVALVFVEPSTRTFQSFLAAVRALGGEVMPMSDPSMSAMAKGESLHDTIKMLEGYGADCIILRHPSRGAARFAAEVAEVPIINAGSGSQEHPTQSMLDLYTILRRRGSIDGVSIGMIGDLRFSRTIPSLSYLASLFNDVKLYFMAPTVLQVRPEVELYLKEKNVKYMKVEDTYEIRKHLREVDVLYVTRLQKERFPDPSEYEKLRGSYVVNRELLSYAKIDVGVMHPLPRVDELSPEIDSLPNAWYFEQAKYG
ncbi:MAG: aspartate carbamoyltransferase, partial [Candidatus Parvarchaeota archaeon]